MQKKKSVFILSSLAVQVFIFVLLATGSGLLVKPVFGSGLPWGNLLTAVLFVLFPINFLVIKREGHVPRIPRQVFRFCVYFSLVAGLFWLPVSFMLSGNWSASFAGGEREQVVWMYYTYGTAILPFAGYFLMRLLSYYFKK